MKDEIKKVIYSELQGLPPEKALLSPRLQIAFENATGKSLSDHLEAFTEAANELENHGYAHFEQLPTKMFRITKGVHFDEW